MPNIPYFQCDTLAYLSSGTINSMTNAEEGIYWRLIVQSWGYSECVLPGDIKVLSRLVKNASQKQVQKVLDMGFTRVGSGYRNERIFEEFQKTCSKSESARYARKCRKDKESPLTDVERTHNERTTNEPTKHKAVSSKHKAVSKEGPKYILGLPDFEIVWEAYPSKDGRAAAKRHFDATVKDHHDFFEINVALENYLEHLKVNTWKKPKNGSTWFNNWQDWVYWEEPMVSDGGSNGQNRGIGSSGTGKISQTGVGIKPAAGEYAGVHQLDPVGD